MSRLTKITAAATLDDLYALIPTTIGCDGSCHRSCGPIGFSADEGRRMLAAGRLVPNHAAGELLDGDTCPALDDQRCAVYDARPALCRIWGVTSGSMRCMAPTCRPAGTALSDDEARAILWRAIELGGRP